MIILSNNQYINLFICEYKSDFNWLKLINYNNNTIAMVK